MDRFGLIGCGISHSGSPALFSEYCKGKYPYDLLDFADFDEAWSRFVEGPYKAVNVTSPFKTQAFGRADIKKGKVAEIGAANILVKRPGGLVEAFNSDYLAVREILSGIKGAERTVIIGGGGAGRAALAAAEDLGMKTALYHHTEIDPASGASLPDGLHDPCDVLVYTLPCAVPGALLPPCRYLLESNYANPSFKASVLETSGTVYISGKEWLRLQALTGYPLMIGECLYSL